MDTHKWEIILAEVKVEGQQLRDLNRDIAESERLLKNGALASDANS
jgi:hypothetical protein